LQLGNSHTWILSLVWGVSYSDSETELLVQANFQMNKYVYEFTNISVRHRLDLFDKLISLILNYSSQVWGFIQGSSIIERVHL